MKLRVGIIVRILAKAPVLIHVQIVLVADVQTAHRPVVPVPQVIHVRLVQMTVLHHARRHAKRDVKILVKMVVLNHV